MKTSFPKLIQRGTFKEEIKDLTLLSHVVDLDHMNDSAFSVISQLSSIKRISQNVDTFNVYESRYCSSGRRNLCMFCSQEEVHEVRAFVDLLVQEACTTNQPSFIRYSLVNDNQREMEADFVSFWWDIENDYILCLGKENCEKIKSVFESLRERWTVLN